jgi:arginyl-tRNA--protein-N-Asp/Glu arginylyltransferase
MKLLFSEASPDYAHYLFPYAIWALPESGEQPAEIFASGFLPSSRFLDRFYLCRNIRVQLRDYVASSENRRVLRKCEGINCRLVARSEFEYSDEKRTFYKKYADAKFGADVMSTERLNGLFSAPIISHVLEFQDEATGKPVGDATLYLAEPEMAYYYYAFYDLSYAARNLGMYMMTAAVDFFARRTVRYLYLGTCYSQQALYKSQFAGAEFFNGFRWSDNLKELKYLILKDKTPRFQHLLELADFEPFYPGGLKQISELSPFQFRCEMENR